MKIFSRLRKEIKIQLKIYEAFREKKENETTNDKIIRDIKLLFEQKDYCYKPVRISNFWNNNYIEYKSNGDDNLSVKEYYLKDIVIDLQKSGAWKVNLTSVSKITMKSK